MTERTVTEVIEAATINWQGMQIPVPRRATPAIDPSEYPDEYWLTTRRREQLQTARARATLDEGHGAINSDVSEDAYFHELVKMFGPFMKEAHTSPDIICRAKADVFKRRFGITSDILDGINELHENGFDCVLAGGKMVDFFNNLDAHESKNDYDLWCTSSRQLEQFDPNELKSKFSWRTFASKRHVSEFIDTRNERQIQVIKNLFASAEDVIGSFDIRACSIAYDGEYIYWVKGALKDVRQKKLVMQCIHPRRATPVRIQKYIQKGYEISAANFGLAAICFLGAIKKLTLEQCLTDREFSILDAMAQQAEEYSEL